MTFPISVSLLSFQRLVFILNKQIWRGKGGQVGGLAINKEQQLLGFVDGSVLWLETGTGVRRLGSKHVPQQTYYVSQTSPLAITDTYTGWPSSKTSGIWPEVSPSRDFIQLMALSTHSLTRHTKSLLKGQTCSTGQKGHWPDLEPLPYS